MKYTSAYAVAIVCSLVSVPCASAEADRLFPGLAKKKTAAFHLRHSHAKKPEAAAPAIEAPEVQEDSAPSQESTLMTVPAPADIGASGFPTLPAVSSMLSKATDQLKTMSAQAGVLQASIARAHQENEVKIAQQKHVYEKKLKVQESRNQLAISVNANISDHIKKLEGENGLLRNATKQILKTNMVMRSELSALKVRLGTVRGFVAEALTTSEDSKSEKASVQQLLNGQSAVVKEATAVQAKAPEAAHSDDADEDDSDENDDDDDSDDTPGKGDASAKAPAKVSLLAVGRSVQRVSTAEVAPDVDVAVLEDEDNKDNATKTAADMAPKDLLAVLQQGVEGLKAEEKQSEQKMKQIFVRDFKIGATRHAALLAQQRKLNATETATVELQKKLTRAKEHQTDTNGRLQKHLSGIGSFLQKLTALAVAKPGEAVGLLDDLPKVVA